MTRQVTDQLYIELDYFTPEDYYVYIAESASAQSVTATVTCTAFRTQEIVLAAFSDAAITAAAEVTRNFEAAISSTATVSATASGFQFADANLAATATMTIDAARTVSTAVDLNVSFTQTATVDRIRYIDAQFTSSVSQDTVAERILAFGSGLSSDAACSCVNYRVRDLASDAGALFNAAIDISITVNSFAVLDSVSTVTITADRQVGTVAADLSATATQSTVGQRVRFADSQLSDQFTLTATALQLIGVVANISSSSSITANLTAKIRPAGYIAWPNTYSTALDNGRLSFTQRNVNNFALVISDDTTEYARQLFDSSAFTVEFLLTAETAQFQNMSSTTSNSDYYRSILNFESGKLWIALRYSSSTTAILQFGVRNDAGTSFTLSTAGLSSLAGDSHIAFVKSGTTIYAFVNGTRVNSTTVSGVFTLDSSTAVTLGRSSILSVTRNNLICKLDELRFSIVARYANNASITVPTTPFANDKTGIALFHMDNSLSPAPAFDQATAGDNGVVTADIAMSSVFTQTTSATRLRTISGSADLSVSTTVTAIIGSIEEIPAALFDDVELTATVVVTRDAASAQSAIFTETASGDRTRSADSTMSSTVSLTAQVERTRNISSNVSATVNQTTAAVKTTDIIATVNVQADITAAIDRTRDESAAVSSNFTQTTDVVRIKQLESYNNSDTTLTAQGDKFLLGDAQLSSQADLSSTIDRIRYGSSAVNSVFTQTAAADRSRTTSSTQSSVFTQSAEILRIHPGAADLSVAVSISITAEVTRNFDSVLSSTVQTVTNAVKTVDVQAENESVSAVLSAVAKIGDFLIDLQSTTQLSATGTRIVTFANLSENRGVSLEADVSGTDLGPFLLLDNIQDVNVGTNALISFWCNEGTIGGVLNTDGIYDGNSNGVNTIEIKYEGSDYFLYYYGNRAQSAVYPYVKWQINYVREDLLHNFLIYIDSGNPVGVSPAGVYRFYLDGVEQSIVEVSDAFIEPKKNHTFNIKDQLLLGYGSSFYAASGVSGYLPYKNLEHSGTGYAVLAQFWMDINTVYDVTDSSLRNKFYNAGWTDLGVDGTATGLSQPDYYVRLRDYQDLDERGTVNSANDNWQWKYFNNLRSAAGTDVYDVSDFTANGDQNNPYVTQVISKLTLSITVAALFRAELSAQSNLSATVRKINGGQSAISSQATITAQSTTLIGTITDLPSTTSLVFNGGQAQFGASSLSSQFTQITNAGAIGDETSDMFVTASLNAQATIIEPIRTEADLVVNGFLTVTIGLFHDVPAALSSEFTIAVDATEIPPIIAGANLTANAQLSAALNYTAGFDSDLNSEFATNIIGERLRRPEAALSVIATETVTVSRLIGGQATLPAIATQLIVGSTISIDPFYQYKVEPESRRGTVLPEDRVFTVESETRVNMII